MKICLNCKKKLTNKYSKYCSNQCQFEFQWKEWCKEVEKLGYFKGYDGRHSGSSILRPKKYILEKQNGRCAICGISKWMKKPAPFILDHIDGDSTNWKVINIRVVCRNCDGQLETFGGKNKGNGKREYIRYRDKKGKYHKRKKRNK
ncbi:MAG TPA: HNH endonuclease [Methanofastidiosum sp.]|nr:HNH endonuclease [Methanofastidiosum sp.]